jgi:hypothetical protein
VLNMEAGADRQSRSWPGGWHCQGSTATFFQLQDCKKQPRAWDKELLFAYPCVHPGREDGPQSAGF